VCGVPRFGFALTIFKSEDGQSQGGVGDDEESWGVDGSRVAA